MLTGEFKHTLDAKGRVFVPAKFRGDLGGSVIIAKTFNKFLVMYSEEEWINFMEKLDALGETEDIGDMKRYIMKNAMPTDVDTQGRISISADHREFANLTKDISFIGMRKYVEIWGTEAVEAEVSGVDIEKFKEQSKKIHLGLC
ncbi:MAG: division/cell wall cluster transcriptional repressor MraZ [Clostridia bacterium]|nr:division/cell wall cluster transcriptional repressor MraZ [Clostridia bacterium]